MGYLVSAVWLGCRVGAVGYLAYALEREGVFCHKADPDTTIARLKAKVPAEVADLYDLVPSTSVELPKVLSSSPRETWNWAVMETGYHLGRIPQYSSCVCNYIKESAQDFSK